MDENLEQNQQPVKKTKKQEKEFSLGREIFEWFYTILIALAIAFLIKGFLFDIVEVEGPSMFPTLENGDRLIVTKLGYKPKQGDIVILDSNYKKRNEYYKNLAYADDKDVNLWYKVTHYFSVPKNLKSKYYVKRVIAQEGQTIDLQDGNVLIDGKIFDEPYYNGETYTIDPSMEFPVTVDEGYVFVMGDNRPRSLDSRDSGLGQVPVEAIIGASRFRIWPISGFGATK